MTGAADPPGRHTDLLSDLNDDLRERQSATPGRLTDTARPDTTLPRVPPDVASRAGARPAAVSRPAPAVEIRVTPLHWCGPAMGRLSEGTGIEVRCGPVRFALTLLTG